MSDEDVELSVRMDKFLRGESLSGSEKTVFRSQIEAAAAADLIATNSSLSTLNNTVSGHGTDIAALQLETAAIATDLSGLETSVNGELAAQIASVAALAADVTNLEAAVTAQDGSIDALETEVSAHTLALAAIAYREYLATTADDPPLTEVQWIAAIATSDIVAGVASVAGLVGSVGASDLRDALDVARFADQTNVANVEAALAETEEKEVLVDSDAVYGADSEDGWGLKWFSIAAIVARAKAVFDLVYGTTEQGDKADSAVQPNTDVTLGNVNAGVAICSSLLVTPVAFAALPAANTVTAGTMRIINNGSVSVMGQAAVGGGAITQRVISNGTNWIVDSGPTGMTNPMTTLGDIIVQGEAGPVRLPIGAPGTLLGRVGSSLGYVAGGNTIYTERSYGDFGSWPGGVYPFMAARGPLLIKYMDAQVVSGGASLSVTIYLFVNGSLAASLSVNVTGHGGVVGRSAPLNIAVGMGDAIAVEMNDGSYMGSGGGTGPVVVGLEWSYT